VLTLEHRIDRAQRLLRMIEEDAPLLAARVAPLSADHQKSVKSYAQRLAERTRAEIEELLHEKTFLGAAEQNPAAAD
jgi:hypothetical protein